MKIAIPVENDNGLNSSIYGHFGSAPVFLIFDSDTTNFQIVENSNKEHLHGQCHPIEELIKLKVDGVVCNGMGLRAINNLNRIGIKVYNAQGAHIVKDIVKSIIKKDLIEMTVEEACKEHSRH